jgi:hypothetical protein
LRVLNEQVFIKGHNEKGGERDFLTYPTVPLANHPGSWYHYDRKNMGAKNFVNQFKNTRRQVRVQMGKTLKNSGRAKKNPQAGERPHKKYSGPKGKQG